MQAFTSAKVRQILIHATWLSLGASLTALAACSSVPQDASRSVMFIEPLDGATVATTFKVRFRAVGVKVEPAGEIVANSGHHHLLINSEAIAAGEAIPFTERHLHFGKGQTEAEVKLAPGAYTLTAQFANGAHQSYGKAISHSIKVIVK